MIITGVMERYLILGAGALLGSAFTITIQYIITAYYERRKK